MSAQGWLLSRNSLDSILNRMESREPLERGSLDLPDSVSLDISFYQFPDFPVWGI